VNAVLYMAAMGWHCRILPKDLPPHSIVQRYFYDWRDSGLWRTISNSLVLSARELEGRDESPTAAIIDGCRNQRAAPDGEIGRLSLVDRT
jgi:transposase